MKKLLGIGNALVDIMIPLENDATLESLELPKGSMQLVDAQRSNAVLTALQDRPKSRSAGGSAANTMHGLAMLGAPSGYIGVVGEDELGGDFVRDLIRAGVEPHLVHSRQETGRAVALVSPDSERTFATFLGAAVELSPDHLSNFAGEAGGNIFGRYDFLHVEGYLVFNQQLVRTAVELAKKHGMTVSIDLASYNVVEAVRDFLLEIMRGYVDIVFANEEEARALTGLEPEAAADEIARMVPVAVVKTGARGSIIRTAGERHDIGIIPVNPVDTTGAGDLYASGFLYGLANNLPLQRCGELGALLSGNVIEFIGSKMTDERWSTIRANVLIC